MTPFFDLQEEEDWIGNWDGPLSPDELREIASEEEVERRIDAGDGDE